MISPGFEDTDPVDALAPLIGCAQGAVPDGYIVRLKDTSAKLDHPDRDLIWAATDRARQSGATIHHEYDSALLGYAATMTADQLRAARADPDVDKVEYDQYAYPARDTPRQ